MPDPVNRLQHRRCRDRDTACMRCHSHRSHTLCARSLRDRTQTHARIVIIAYDLAIARSITHACCSIANQASFASTIDSLLRCRSARTATGSTHSRQYIAAMLRDATGFAFVSSPHSQCMREHAQSLHDRDRCAHALTSLARTLQKEYYSISFADVIPAGQ